MYVVCLPRITPVRSKTPVSPTRRGSSRGGILLPNCQKTRDRDSTGNVDTTYESDKNSTLKRWRGKEEKKSKRRSKRENEHIPIGLSGITPFGKAADHLNPPDSPPFFFLFVSSSLQLFPNYFLTSPPMPSFT